MPIPGSQSDNVFFLPDFCHPHRVLGVVLAAELLAFVLTLASPGLDGSQWNDLAMKSIFIQWVALVGAGVLCIERRWLAQLSPVKAATLSYLSLLVVTVVCSEVAWWLLRHKLTTLPLVVDHHMGFLLKSLAISAIVSALTLRYFYIQHQWRRQIESETQARVQALQSRIRPHFLFNSLNTIASLTRSRPETAEQAVVDLAEMFRVGLSDAKSKVTLGSELELCEQYLRLEVLRLGERLNYELNTGELPRDALVPALILQPLLENAVYHGIETRTAGGTVRLYGQLADATVTIHIENPQPSKADTRDHRNDGNQLAQQNIRERLSANYGNKGRLSMASDTEHYRIVLQFPYER